MDEKIAQEEEKLETLWIKEE